MAPNRPVGRKKNVTEGGSGAYRRGEAQGGGPVGSSGGYRKESAPHSSGGSRATRVGGGLSLPVILIAILYMVFGRGFGGSTGSPQQSYQQPEPAAVQTETAAQYTNDSAGGSFNDFYEYFNQQTGGSASAPTQPAADSSSLDTSVASGVPGKRTRILGNGRDQVTIMVYMCGTDLESRSGMATSDLVEMSKASFGDKVNLLVYTGGCTRWQNSVVSSGTNQIYRIREGKMERLVADDGPKAMTDPRHPELLYPLVRGELPGQPQRTDLLGSRRRIRERIRL